MVSEVLKWLTVIVCVFSTVDLSSGCGQKTRQKRQDGPDFAGMAAVGIGMGMDLLQQGMQKGVGFNDKFEVKIGN